MQKTISTSLGKHNFFLEEEAYSRLNSYLESIRRKFSSYSEGQEILKDIENRIAEKFLDIVRDNKERVIDLGDVESLIASMGEPEEMDGDTPRPSGAKSQTTSKKLYRDPDSAMFGGVAAGLGAYLGLEPVLVRIFFILTTFLNGFGVIGYFILWLVTPEAKTATEKLEMKGTPITLGRVDEMMKKAAEKVNHPETKNRARQFAVSLEKVTVTLVAVLGRIFAVILNIVAGLILAALIAAFVFAISNIASPGLDFPLRDAIGPGLTITLLVSGFLLALIPFAFILNLASLLRSRWSQARTQSSIIMAAVWLIALLVIAFAAARAIPLYRDYLSASPAYQETVKDLQARDFKALHISNGINVTLVPGEYSAILSGRARDLELVSVNNENGTLRLSRRSLRLCIFCAGPDRITLAVSAPELRSLNGSNAVNFSGNISGGEMLSVVLRNASRATLEVASSTKDMDLDVSNASRADISGQIGTARIHAANASRVNGLSLAVRASNVSAENASHIEIAASEALTGAVRNGSTLKYAGTPALSVDTENGSNVSKISP